MSSEPLAQPNLPLVMERDYLADIPCYPLPADYTVHWYEPGDEQHWLAIQLAAEKYLPITPELFQREFGSHADLLHERLFFLRAASGETAATIAAWFDVDPANPMGRIHWVAVKPTYQGRGLANCLMTLACERLRQLGHERAILTTSTARVAAIQLYRKFGFH
jgi:ribosomal protein S18 acetylase RimI-like enzyme